jgi:hypothetical protein
MSGGKGNDPVGRGPKGGRKHTPGRGHDRKSKRQKDKAFRKRAARKREQRRREAEEQWRVWDSLPDDVKPFRHELYPKYPRPGDG